jgi:hypothetical protein
LRQEQFVSPVILQSIISLPGYDALKRGNAFIPKYHRDCPKTLVSDLDGFSGILRVGSKNVPVIDLFIRSEEANESLLIADLSKYVRWKQYSPVDAPVEEEDVIGFLLVRIMDMNQDEERRQRIIAEDPEWLRAQEDKDRYLRRRVLVNVYEKFSLEIVERRAGIRVDLKDNAKV